MKIYKLDTDNIFFAGDIHGNFDIIGFTIKSLDIDNCGIIFCGDIGIGFEKEEFYNQKFKHLSKTLEKRNVHIYMFRGNHDCKSYFDGEHFTNFEYVHVIPDYSVIQTPNRNILCVGGGTSIDRLWRKQKMDLFVVDYMKHHSCDYSTAEKNIQRLYWDDEAMVYDETELSKLNELGIQIDTVCTHSSPSFCQPLTKDGIASWLQNDENLETDLDAERYCCDMILDYLKENNHPLENWYNGHFHFHNVEIIDGVKYTLLNMCREKLDIV